MEHVLVAVGTLLVAATFLPLARWQGWWVRIFDFPRLQIAAALVLVGVAHLITIDAEP